MIETHYEFRKDDILISSDPARLQPEAIYGFLSQAYWAKGRPREVIWRSMENSLCFGAYDSATSVQVGLVRVVTDFATHAWLCDVFVREDYRGRGLGKQLVACALSHPELQGVRRWILATSDAHELYRRFGFSELENPEKFMERFTREATA